jgi:hypothetical protein
MQGANWANQRLLTINGFVISAIGLFLKVGGYQRLEGAGIFALTSLGVFLAMAWRSLIISFGQLNTGKFRVIQAMEKYLPAAIFAAEWDALDQGRSKAIYKSFTDRERLVPISLAVIYAASAIMSVLVWIGWWHVA